VNPEAALRLRVECREKMPPLYPFVHFRCVALPFTNIGQAGGVDLNAIASYLPTWITVEARDSC